MDNKKISEEELEQVIGGMTNPEAGMSEEQARKIAEKLGEGSDMGSWNTMSGEQFMEWWKKTNRNAQPLSEDDLRQVAAGLHNMPEKPDEKDMFQIPTEQDADKQYEFHFYHL